MKYIVSFTLMLAIFRIGLGQKPAIDTSILGKWHYVANAKISNNGNYFSYTIENQPLGGSTLIVRGVRDSTWQKQYIQGKDGFFSGDNNMFIFNRNDTLFFLKLGKDSITAIPNVSSYKRPDSDKAEWLAYQVSGKRKQLVLYHLFSGNQYEFQSTIKYWFDVNGDALIALKGDKSDGTGAAVSLQWINTRDRSINDIWSDEISPEKKINISRYKFSIDGSQLVFLVQEENKTSKISSIWHYEIGMNKAIMLVKDDENTFDSGISINNSDLKISRNGQWVFFQLNELLSPNKSIPNSIQVDIWNYKDVVLQSEQLLNKANSKMSTAVVNIKGGKVLKVTEGEESVVSTDGDNFAIITDNKHSTTYWWENSSNSYYLFSLKDGSKQLIVKSGNISATKRGNLPFITFSPHYKFVIYYDGKRDKYYSYEIATRLTRDISKTIPAKLSDVNDYSPLFESYPVGIGGWIGKDSALLIYDNFDIWLADPLCNFVASNITNGYGKLHNIKFRLLYEKEALKGLSSAQSILVGAFNTVNKENGFYRVTLNRKSNPTLLYMGPYTLNHDMSILFPAEEDPGMAPLKARDTDVWVVKRQTVSEAPNYYISKDLIHFKALSQIQPEKEYNWLTAELITWRQLDGTKTQGILYKPENFDSKKKYPIIFYYYEKLSSRLYSYLKPGLTAGALNIPYFVSNGYLVFTPDIHYSIAKQSNKVNGESACNALISAAKHLSKFPFIDVKKMGIQGHSFGGQETNYLITHTSIFAAAAEAAGTSDAVSSYLSIAWPLSNNSSAGSDRQHITEVTQGRMGSTLWDRPDLYIKASSIMKANKVTSPLLIMHNKGDAAVPWGQAVEMFMALRRLKKKVWMLQYDEGDHSLSDKEAVDYTIRLTQFFDHYLKGEVAPVWMTQGIPATKKGIDTGFALDFKVNCGINCSVCNNKKTSITKNIYSKDK